MSTLRHSAPPGTCSNCCSDNLSPPVNRSRLFAAAHWDVCHAQEKRIQRAALPARVHRVAIIPQAVAAGHAPLRLCRELTAPQCTLAAAWPRPMLRGSRLVKRWQESRAILQRSASPSRRGGTAGCSPPDRSDQMKSSDPAGIEDGASLLRLLTIPMEAVPLGPTAAPMLPDCLCCRICLSGCARFVFVLRRDRPWLSCRHTDMLNVAATSRCHFNPGDNPTTTTRIRRHPHPYFLTD